MAISQLEFLLQRNFLRGEHEEHHSPESKLSTMRQTHGGDEMELHQMQRQMDLQLKEKDDRINQMAQEVEFFKKQCEFSVKMQTQHDHDTAAADKEAGAQV